jgi:hypothetical protein
MSDAPAPWRSTRAGGAAIALAALLLAGLAIRNAAQAVLREVAPAAVVLPPYDARALAAQADRRFAATGTIDPETRALYRAALARAPLLADPLALAARDAEAQGDGVRAERLMLAARARDPRRLPVRLWLLDRFVRTGRLDAALVEAGAVMRLDPRAQPQLVDMLGMLATSSAGQRALTRALARQPAWRTAFFLTVSRGLSDPSILLALQQAAPPRRGPAAATERRVVYAAMVAAGQGDAALAAWRGQQGRGQQGAGGDAVVYDETFAGLPGAPPFNWSLADTRAGSATRLPGGGVALHLTGGRQQALAEQTVALAPGRYRLAVTARRTGAPGDAQLEAQVLCVDTGDIARLSLADLGAQAARRELPLAVGAECPIARVRLVALPGETGTPADVMVTRVAIVPGA